MTTPVVRAIAELRETLAAAKTRSRIVGCVPTMGALHAGHGALMERARTAADFVVVTVFVNPTQFDRQDDYRAYAVDLETDRGFCEARGVDIVFAPPVSEMYPSALETWVSVPRVATHLCGASRTGHFQGVATVVAKLFNIVQPNVACFGQKDLQQFMIIRQMVLDLNFPVRLIAVETVREADGLAMSSRNIRITPEQRRVAPLLYQALRAGQQTAASGELQSLRIRLAALHILEAEPAIQVEYVEVVDSRMQPVESVGDAAWIAAAVWVGSTRLIDNVPLPASAG
jgi:pantoate--beta-alanine ligase